MTILFRQPQEGSMADPESNGFVFDAETTSAVGAAVDEMCERLNINGDVLGREAIAMWVVDLVRSGGDLAGLYDRVVSEASAGRK
jgi:hypothetical protein